MSPRFGRRGGPVGDVAHLVLAFDADCHRCRAVAAAVARVTDRVEVLPLRDYRVAAWRAEAPGPDAPWAPTLVEVTGAGPDEGADRVRVWTGPALVPALGRRLGPRAALAVGAAVATTLARVRTPSPGRGA